MKQEYAEQVAARIIEQLEQGTAPWLKPWQPGELRLPYNPTTGKEYRGMNTLWLHSQGHSDPRWMTYNQAAGEGAQVRKGEKGSHIVYWKFSDEKKATDDQGRPILDDNGKQKTIQVQLERPRSFTAVVFNASQIDGLPPLEARPVGPEPERHALAETILANSGAKIQHEPGDRAFYSPGRDSITLPERKQFETADNYYATALHELGHWTGHPSRLDRDLSHPFGSEGYAREELRAEIASLMVGERLDIGHDPGQHAAYIGSWIKALKEDPREIFRAASDAERISGYVMDFEHERSQEQAAERQPVPQIAPELAAELQQEHENAIEGYSPLESWQMMKAEAERNGYKAHIDHGNGDDPLTGTYAITYSDREGNPTGITTDLFSDGKLYTSINGQRLSAIISNDDESQPGYLRDAISRHEADKQQAEQQTPQARLAEQEKVQQQFIANGDADAADVHRAEVLDELRAEAAAADDNNAPAYTVQSRRMVPDNAAQHAGQHAVFVQLDDGRRSWGFGGDDESAEKSAVGRAAQIGLAADRAPTRAVLHEQPENPMPSRTYLAVPYAEKNEAKAQGAKWDKEAKAWYAEAGVDVATSGLARWSLDKPGVVKAKEPESPETQFLQALKDAGLDIDAAKDGKAHPVDDGKMHRVPTTGEKGGGTSGAYAYHKTGTTPGGFIQNYKTGEVVHWKPEGKTEQLTAEQRAQQATEAAKQRQERNTERAAEHGATATAAQALWSEAPAATGDNAYCKAKGITNPVGLRVVPSSVSPEAAALGIKIAQTAKEAKELREADPKNRVFKAGDLLIPGNDTDGKLWTLQSVNPYFKSLMKGGRKAGLFTVAGDSTKFLDQNKDTPLVLAEGYATGDTVSRLMGGQPVIVAFDSGNLDAVAGQLRERNPGRPLLIAADNDHNAPKTLDAKGNPKVNVGLVKAKEAAEKHGGGVMVPKFKDGDKGSDWNDLAASNGDESARRMLSEEMAVAKRDAAVTAERLTTLARTRDMEARNDPTTSADDAKVASERGHAAEVLASAQSQLGEVRSMAADGVTGNGKGTRSPAAVKAGIDRKTEAMHDQAKDEREHVLNHAAQGADGAAVSWKKLPEQAKQAMIAAVKEGREVTLPKDAPAKLKQMAGHEPAPKSRSRGIDAGL
ncbi:TPA: zincin-like metallopeptidase domain-containing protein [Yersinia enterocolitica]